MGRGSKPTIRDVAAKAGVSLTTVSYVLSGRVGGTTRISKPTEDRVRAAVRELGYVANRAAQGMRRGKTDMVAVSVGDLERPWDRALASAAARILPQQGYQPVILLGDLAWRDFMLAGGADGLILGYISENSRQDHTMKELARRGVPQVVVSQTMQPQGFDVLAPEPEQGFADAMAYLTGRHARIGCLRRSEGGPERGRPSRYSRYVQGLKRAGLRVDQALVRTSLHQRHRAHQVALELLGLDDPPTALLCTDDMEALAAARAAARLGIRIPEDLEIIGAGNSVEGQEADPALSTVGPEPIFDEVVHMLVRRLARLDDADGDGGYSGGGFSGVAEGERRPAPWRLHHRGTTVAGGGWSAVADMPGP
ncbi:MAG TPA: LacI family DNA-binding transcriptional regulator [Micrococcaceae bacterium]|nr:LacI family DNA-binding transcriptional regulator [Micrococcaceae bacterium]